MRRINRVFSIFLLALALAWLTSCSGGGGGGIGGSGVTSTGAITGFGSVFVNGVEYETGSAQFSVNESSGAEGDLAIGMVVRVRGSVNDDGITGTAQSIDFDQELEGPIAAPPTADSDDETKTFTVLGTTVIVTRSTTVFDNETPGFNFETIAERDVVGGSGFYDGDGVLHATYIEKEGEFDPASPGDTEVEVEGVISNLDDPVAGQFRIGTLVVIHTSAQELPEEGLSDGLRVEVEGRLQDATTVVAEEIEVEDDYPENADKVEIQGIVSGSTGLSSFLVNGQPTDASGSGVAFEPASLRNSLANPSQANGMEIEVEGPIDSGILNARAVRQREGEVEIMASVTGIGANTLTLQVTSTGFVEVGVDATITEYEDEVEELDGFGFSDIKVDDFVKVKGYETATGVVASKVKRKEVEDKVKIQARVSGSTFDGAVGTVTILGVTIDSDGSTDYEINEISVGAAAFFADLVDGDIVEVEDEFVTGMTIGDGIAEEMEIED